MSASAEAGADRSRAAARPPIAITRHLPEAVVARLRAVGELRLNEPDRQLTGAQLRAACAGAAAIVATGLDPIDAELLDAAGAQLRIVANVAVGYDNVDVEAAAARGVVVTNTPDVLTDDTADMAFALLLAAARRVAEGDRMIRRGEPWTWTPTFMIGARVSQATLGIVGLGRIGQAVARRAAGFGMRVLYASRRPAPAEVERELGATRCPLEELLERSDFVSLHCPLTEGTRHLIGAAELRRMKPTAVLVNTARGAVVDERALAEALRDGEIAAAGLDVFEREPHVERLLLGCESAVLAPHLGSATDATRGAMAALAADNVERVLAGRPPLTPVAAAAR